MIIICAVLITLETPMIHTPLDHHHGSEIRQQFDPVFPVGTPFVIR
jgi:hypothetical protein